jgi:hypothetical protein
MIDDMTIRKLTPKTRQGYIRSINDFAAFLGRSPPTRRAPGQMPIRLSNEPAPLPTLRGELRSDNHPLTNLSGLLFAARPSLLAREAYMDFHNSCAST